MPSCVSGIPKHMSSVSSTEPMAAVMEDVEVEAGAEEESAPAETSKKKKGDVACEMCHRSPSETIMEETTS